MKTDAEPTLEEIEVRHAAEEEYLRPYTYAQGCGTGERIHRDRGVLIKMVHRAVDANAALVRAGRLLYNGRQPLADALRAITLDAVNAELTRRGWHFSSRLRYGTVQDGDPPLLPFDRWEQSVQGEDAVTTDVPSAQTAGDYHRRLHECIDDIAAADHVSPAEVLAGMMTGVAT